MVVLRRLLGFLAPYRRGVAAAFLLSWGAMLATVAIPYMTGRAIDAVQHHNRHGLVTWAVLVAAAGLVRLVLSVFAAAGRRTRSRSASSSTCATLRTASSSGSSSPTSTASRRGS